MTYLEIKTAFEEIVGASIDDTTLYLIMGLALTKVEDERDWEYLKKWDTSSNSAASSDTYLSMKTQPADWRKTLRIVVNNIPYLKIPLERRIEYKDAAFRFYEDVANSQFALTGRASGSNTINQCYKKTTTTPSVANQASSLLFPARFHPFLPFKMAEIYSDGLDDADDTTFKLSPGQAKAAKGLYDAMIAWDDELKLEAMEGEQVGDEPETVKLGNM